MNPPVKPKSPLASLSLFSSGVSGQTQPANSIKVPHTAVGMWNHETLYHLIARKPPPTTNNMNIKWSTATESAAILYVIYNLIHDVRYIPDPQIAIRNKNYLFPIGRPRRLRTDAICGDEHIYRLSYPIA